MKKVSKHVIIIALVFGVMIVLMLSFKGYKFYLNKQLFRAIETEDIEQVESILERGADVARTKYNKYAFQEMFWHNPTPLIAACDVGNQQIVELLLEYGADINQADPWVSHTPLQNALTGDKQSRFSLAMYLIKQGADFYTYEGTDSPLERSVSIFETDTPGTIAQGFELFKYLYEHDAELDFSAFTLLTYACTQNNVNVVEYLLENGYADVNETNQEGKTGLMEAIKSNSVEVSKLLLEYGADKSIYDYQGKTAYDYALETENIELIALFEK